MSVTKNLIETKNSRHTMKSYCNHCDEIRDTRLEVKSETFNIRGMSIEIESEVRVCKVCNATVYDEYLDGINIEKAFNAYREKYNVMSTEEIVALRRKYGLSQRGLAALLGWGAATVSRYETGAIPSNSHHMMLVNLRDDLQFVRNMFNDNKDKLPKLDHQRMNTKLNDEQEKSNERDTVALLSKKMNADDSPVYQGYVDFDFNKLVGMVVYFTNKLEKVSKTKLMKLLFYSDFRNFRETGLSISGMTYRHLPFGLVPDHHYLILDALSEMGHIRLEPFKDYEGEYLVPENELDTSVFDEDEVEILDSVINDFEDMNAAEISEYSHREDAYTKTESKAYISYDYADLLFN